MSDIWGTTLQWNNPPVQPDNHVFIGIPNLLKYKKNTLYIHSASGSKGMQTYNEWSGYSYISREN